MSQGAALNANSPQPKFEMMNVRVHIRSEMNTHANTKNAIVNLSC